MALFCSHSIKTLAKYLGFKWHDQNPSGAASIEWYDQCIKTRNPDIKQRILDYNEDDCKATRVLADGVRAMGWRTRRINSESGSDDQAPAGIQRIYKRRVRPVDARGNIFQLQCSRATHPTRSLTRASLQDSSKVRFTASFKFGASQRYRPGFGLERYEFL